MKRAVSISLGSAKRDKVVSLPLLGATVQLERLGTNGDMARAAQHFRELDGQVDAFGLGGTDLGFQVGEHFYPLHSIQPMVRDVKRTPLVDGGGLKNTLERRVGAVLEQHLKLGQRLTLPQPRVLLTGGIDRWGMAAGFEQAGFECVFGDFMFAFGLDIPIRSTRALQRLAAFLMPLVGRLPFAWLYPTGEQQEKSTPKFTRWYQWATVIAGDCHYIKRHMPPQLAGKIICTNTTTPDDVAQFRAAGVRTLVTTTPVFEGRSFGTNLLEAALVAAQGLGRKLTDAELTTLIDQLGLEPTLVSL